MEKLSIVYFLVLCNFMENTNQESILYVVSPISMRIVGNVKIEPGSSCTHDNENNHHNCSTVNQHILWLSNGSLTFIFNNANISRIMIVYSIDYMSLHALPRIQISGSSFQPIDLTVYNASGESSVSSNGNETDVSLLSIHVLVDVMQNLQFNRVTFFNCENMMSTSELAETNQVTLEVKTNPMRATSEELNSVSHATTNEPTPSCETFLITVVVLAIIIMLLIVAGTATIVTLVIMLHRKKINIDPHHVIYETPDDMKQDSFHMTQSSVYGIHKTVTK